MKTPRKILLGQHREAEAKLDALRRRVIGSLQESSREFKVGVDRRTDPSPRPSPLRRGEGEATAAGLKVGSGLRPALLIRAALRKAWVELIWPSRRAWAGIAAVWLVVLAANLDMKATSPRAPGAARVAVPRSGRRAVIPFRDARSIHPDRSDHRVRRLVREGAGQPLPRALALRSALDLAGPDRHAGHLHRG